MAKTCSHILVASSAVCFTMSLLSPGNLLASTVLALKPYPISDSASTSQVALYYDSVFAVFRIVHPLCSFLSRPEVVRMQRVKVSVELIDIVFHYFEVISVFVR